jgi:two-component system, OmpR family, sensor histidine kinase MprB
VFNQVLSQHITPNGAVSQTFGDIKIPVSKVDRLIAKPTPLKALPNFVSVNIEGLPYRVATVPLPGGGAIQVAQSLAEANGVLGSLRWRFGWLALAITMLGFVSGLLIARPTIRSLERFTAFAEEVASGGTPDPDLVPSGSDEVSRLRRAFADMLASLRGAREQQTRLVHDAGHELRTPLTSLRTNVDLLTRKGPSLDADTQGKVLADVDHELNELIGLVNELVELAADETSVEPEAVLTVKMMVEHVAQRESARSSRTICCDASPWKIEARPRSLERAIRNLVENALKYSPLNSEVLIEAKPGSIVVIDHGPGVFERDLPHIFERFYRSVTSRSQPGSGLGLAIVEEVARFHGGTTVADNLPGGGAAIGMVLPIHQDPEDEVSS